MDAKDSTRTEATDAPDAPDSPDAPDPVEAVEEIAHEVGEPRRREMTRSHALVLLALAAACLLVVAVFALLVTSDRSPLDSFDQWGRRAEDWADDHGALVLLLRIVEVGFATIGMIIWTSLIVLAMAGRRRYRPAAFAIVVMISASLVTTGLKLWLGRDRPEWQDTVDVLGTHSFPSGHASSSAALAGILIVLARNFVLGPRLKAGVTVLAVVIWLAVCLDRVMLGRHFPSDVVAGTFLGAAIVLLGIVVFDPARVPPRDR